jgi:DNA-binding IclR family transcriptional regulator
MKQKANSDLKYKIAPALERGLTIIEMLAKRNAPIGFNEFSTELQISKASTSRLLKVLKTREYINKDEETGKYLPGSGMMILKQLDVQRQHLITQVRPILSGLMNQTQNTIALFYWNAPVFEMLDKEIHPNSVGMQPVGKINSLSTDNPWGWLVYSSLDNNEKISYGKEIASQMIKFDEQINHYHDNGFVFDDGCILKGIRRFAAPIYDHTDKIVAVLAIGGNYLTIPDDKIKEFGNLLVQKALLISKSMGLKR